MDATKTAEIGVVEDDSPKTISNDGSERTHMSDNVLSQKNGDNAPQTFDQKASVGANDDITIDTVMDNVIQSTEPPARTKSSATGFKWFWQRDTSDNNKQVEKADTLESPITRKPLTELPPSEKKDTGSKIADSESCTSDNVPHIASGDAIEESSVIEQEVKKGEGEPLEDAERFKFKWWWQRAAKPISKPMESSNNTSENKEVAEEGANEVADLKGAATPTDELTSESQRTSENVQISESAQSPEMSSVAGSETESADTVPVGDDDANRVIGEEEAEQMYVHEGYNNAAEIPAHMTDYCGRVFEGTMRSTLSKEPIYLRRWEPRDVEIRSLLFICHDHSSHCERYEQVIGGFLKQGTLVFSQDHEGHGHSAGQRADMYLYKTFVADVLKHVYTVKEHHAGLPLFGWGHGMGACILITAARKYPSVFNGLILTSPMLRADPLANTRFKKALASTLSFFSPSLGVGQRLFAEDISDDPLEQKRWLADTLIYRGQVKIRWANCMLEAMDENCSNLAELETPFITMQGNENDVVLSDNAMFIYQNAKSVDKQLQYIDGGRHDLHACSQLIRQHVMNTLYSWVAERSGESAEEVHHRLAAVSSFRLGTPVGLSTSAGVKSAACNETNANSASGLEDVIESDSASIGHEDLTRSLEIKSGSEGTTVESADHPRGLLSETEGDGDAQAAIEGDAVDAGVMLSGLEERRALEGDTAPLQNAPVLPTDERSLSESDEVLIGDGEKSLCAGNDDEASPAKIRMHKQMSQPLSKQYLNNCSSAATEGDDIIGDSGRRRSNSRRHSCADFSDTTTMVSINFDVNDWFSENADAEAARENGAGKTKKANVLRHASTQGDAQVGTGRRKHASFGVRMSDAANLGMSKDGVVLVFADESGIRYSRDTTVENTVAEAQQIYKHSDDAEHELAANSGSGT